jgi:hypothetical protein
MFTVAIDASTAGIMDVHLQDKGGGLQPVSYWARELNPTERGNTYSAYDLEALHGRIRRGNALDMLP